MDKDRRKDLIVQGQQHGLQLRYLKQEVAGFVLYVDDRVPEGLRLKALSVIEDDLKEICRIFPHHIVSRLYAYPIRFWLNLNNGKCKKGCVCHCIDLPDEYMACKSHSVEIFDLQDFLEQTSVQPAQLLHEISHWVHHDRVHQENLQSDKWKSSSGRLSSLDHTERVARPTFSVKYQMSNFRNTVLNGSFVLEEASLKSARSYQNLVLVKPPAAKSGSVRCRCTDQRSAEHPKCLDRWHLEVDGQVLAYRTSTDFGRKVVGWNEWINGEWHPTDGQAQALLLTESSLQVEGFSQIDLNGQYVEDLTLESWSIASGSTKRWIKMFEHGPDVVLRFTNMYSEFPESATVPFDRWHIERGGDCQAYLCNDKPWEGTWEELNISPTDQMILNAYSTSLYLYSHSCERVGCYCAEPHYAATNHKEFFAECSEAYFSTTRFRNDYFPYIHAELKGYDRAAYAMCERIWGPRHEDGIEARYLNEFWPRCKTEGSAAALVATPDGQMRFLQCVFQAAQEQAKNLLSRAG